MKRDHDIERLLQRFPGEPRPEVKRSVLDRFAKTFASGRSTRHVAGWWHRPIPLYAAAVVFVLALGLAFFAGRWGIATERSGSIESSQPAAAPAVTWEAAVKDLL
jgi:hypothetical protein